LRFLSESSSDAVPVALAVLDPDDLTVRWHNEHVLGMLPGVPPGEGIAGVCLTDLIPLAKSLGVAARLREVVRTGEPLHIRTHVVSAADLGATISASAYRLHSGELLLVTDRR
jgi:hypothetical protein